MDQERNILEDFGYRLRELRKAHGFSQESFAACVELDRTYIGGIERGERNVSLRNIARIASAFDLTISELMAGVGSGDESD